MVAFGVVDPRQALGAIDFATIVLPFSMMLIVAHLRIAGCFDWITQSTIARLRRHHLLPIARLLRRPVHHRRRRGSRRPDGDAAPPCHRVEHMHRLPVFASVTAVLCNVVSNVPAVMLPRTIVPGSRIRTWDGWRSRWRRRSPET
jgi:Na+/H+ antiporter NhaD/arsenite permease-like protein